MTDTIFSEDDNEPMVPPEGFVDTKTETTESVAEVKVTEPVQEKVVINEPPVVQATEEKLEETESAVAEEVSEPTVEPVVEEVKQTPEVQPTVVVKSAQETRDEKFEELKSHFSGNYNPTVDPAMRLISKSWNRTGTIPHRVHSKVLVRMLDELVKCRETNTTELGVDNTLSFESDKTRHNETAIWEEGGATDKSGTALLVTDDNGNKLQAITAYNNVKDGNGKHALLKVKTGYFIVTGVVLDDKDAPITSQMNVHYVISIDRDLKRSVTKNGVREEVLYDSVNTILVKMFVNGVESYNVLSETEPVVSDPELDKLLREKAAIWSIDHPAIVACNKQMRTMYAYKPIYIADYSNHRFCYDDYRDAINDKEFINAGKRYDTLKEMYEEVDKVLGDNVLNTEPSRHVIVETVLDVGKDKSGEDKLLVYVAGVIYDTKAQTSAGHRLIYGLTVLGKGDNYYDIENRNIIDTNPSLVYSYDFVVQQINRMGTERPKSSVRRMTVTETE